MNDLVALPKLDDRTPQWNLSDLKARDCPFCRSSGIPTYLRPDGLQVNWCDPCGAFFVAIAPSSERLEEWYHNYTAKHHTNVSLAKRGANYMLAGDPSSDFRIKELISVSAKQLQDEKVLDVGCGVGNNLLSFKRLGADVEGMDLDIDAVRFVRDVLGIEMVRNCRFEDFETKSSYDVIVMFDFIEHPIEPLATLHKARELLNKNGLLAIWTPNASFITKHNDTTALQVDLEHMQYISSKTCSCLADYLGLELVHLESVGFSPLRDYGKNLKSLKSLRSSNYQSIRRSFKSSAIEIIQSMPGYAYLHRICQRIRMERGKERLGNYHLYCIMQDAD